MKETCFNLFLYGDDLTISKLGVAVHQLDGSDHDKQSALSSLVDTDYQIAAQYPLQEPLDWPRYQALQRLGHELKIFESIFQELYAPSQPFVVVTPVVNGKPCFQARRPASTPMYRDAFKGTSLEKPGTMIDWLEKYVSEQGFDLPRLINDDYFLAIKLLYNNGHFVSCNKLLMSCIDTLAFVDAGDMPGNFQSWLDKYADLASLSITSSELWEFRNSLLHMTNLNSRKVQQGKVAALVFYVGTSELPHRKSALGTRCVSLRALINVIAAAISKWVESYNNNPDKWADFVMRYDLTISDSRMAYFSIPDHIS
ncbi:MAG TPA: hypothetical protein VIJ65_04915 [Acidobacteriaceae bacterium]